MSQIDIVARLQLRADQFASETGQRFAEMKTRAASTAQEIRTEFTGAFAEVQKLSKTALEMPRTRSGALDLSGEITSLRQAAAAADLKATSARQLSVAMAAAAQSERTVTESMRLEADAAMVAARAEEANATAIRQRILALEAVQVELNKTAVVTTANSKAANDNSLSLGQQRQSTMMLGQQVQDFAVQAANGGSIATAFSQQVGQAAFALNGMGGAAGKVGAFLSTGWGTAVLVGLTVLTPLVSKILDGNDALEEAVGKLRKDAEETRVAAEAKDRFARSEEGLTAAIRDQLTAQQKAIEAERTAAETADINARARLNQTLQIRQQTAALLEQAIAQEQVDRQRSSAPGQRGELATLALTESAGRVAGLQAQLQANQQAITEARTAYNNAQVDLAAEQAKRAADPIERINEQYRQMERNARNAARGNAELTKGLFDQIKALEQRRKAAVQAEQDRQSAARAKPPALGTQIRNERASDILAAAQRYTGAREDTASGRATLKDLFSTAGISIDPDKVAWCAAFVNAVLSGQGIKGTGSLSARSFLGYGTATDRPTQGDIVVLKRGDNASQGHVGFYAGERGGRVMVTGGNQGDAVGTQSFARSDVLGFRRAPTASANFKSNAREAAQEVKELDRALDDVKKRFDPATAAAADFAERLGKITELKAAGRLTAQEADDLTFKALIEEGARRRDAQLKAWKDALGDVPDMAAGVSQYDQEQAAKWDRASVDLQESQQRRAEANLRDLSDLYYDLFDGSSANIWANFQRRAFGALADVAAKETVKLFSLGGQSQQGGGEGGQAAVEQLKSINAGITKLPFGISKETAKTVIQGAGIGAVGGSVFASITGGKNNAVASSVGGVLGDVAGKAIGKSVAAGASGLLKSLGGAAGPLGAIAGGVLGGLVGGLFQKTKQASSTLTFGAGGLGAAGAVGTGTAEKAAASASANSVVGSLNRIAEALGGDVTGAGSVSIGYRPGHKDGAYRVDTTGQGRLTGVLAFATEEEAIRAAIADALKDGVIGGISDASKRILAAGGDLEKAITKASLIESVPKSLKAMLDPVGAAVDELNRSFQKTVDALKEGGATAEQMAQAQQLYDLQLAQVKNSTESASASLKSFRDSLVVGSSSPLSLRDQEAAAVTKLQPFLDQIAAGKAIDQAKYQEAARSYLDVERQLYGSTQAFFEAFDKVQASTAKAIATIDNAVPVTAGVASPFAKETAASAAATAAGVQTGNLMTEDTNDLLAQLVAQNAQLIAALGGSATGSNFIGSNRSFVAAR